MIAGLRKVNLHALFPFFGEKEWKPATLGMTVEEMPVTCDLSSHSMVECELFFEEERNIRKQDAPRNSEGQYLTSEGEPVPQKVP